MPKADTHVVLGRTDEGFEILAKAPSYDEALEIYYPLDNARVEEIRRNVGTRTLTYKFFEVRSAADPKVKAAKRAKIHKQPERAAHVSNALIAAAKDYAKANGYEGRPGGWIYNRYGKPVCQGWAVFAARVRNNLLYLPGLGWRAR